MKLLTNIFRINQEKQSRLTDLIHSEKGNNKTYFLHNILLLLAKIH